MNVADMKRLIADMPDDAQILVWVGHPEIVDGKEEIDYEAIDVEDDYHLSGDGHIPAVHLSVIQRSPI